MYKKLLVLSVSGKAYEVVTILKETIEWLKLKICHLLAYHVIYLMLAD